MNKKTTPNGVRVLWRDGKQIEVDDVRAKYLLDRDLATVEKPEQKKNTKKKSAALDFGGEL